MKQNKEKKKKGKKEGFFASAKSQYREHKTTFTVYWILRMLVIATLVFSAIRGAYESVFVCGLTLLMLIAPAIIERKLRISLPTTLEIIILLFIFAAEIMGEIHYYYMRVPHWDTMLHTVNGFLFAAVGFSLLDIINRDKHIKFQLSPFYLAVVAFCFSMTIGVLWEFFEFSCDMILHTDTQKDFIIQNISSVALDPTKSNTPVRIENIQSVAVNGQDLGINGYLDIGLIDTMKDLFVNFAGAVIFSVIGFFYVKNRGKGKFAKRFIPTIEDDEKNDNQEKEQE